MKPQKLILSGWGPYKDETVIDFSKLNTELFLITGQTGAGKTTLFDAIAYALFGILSGEVREKGTVRSDFADENTQTYVELYMTHKGLPYHIVRNPEYMRPKKKKGGESAFTKEKENAALTLPDGSMITILRTGFFVPSYIARSTDGGHTWSEPTKFDYCGTQPRLHTFKNGVTVAAYGRPGLYIRATDDPSGMTWDEPIEIIPRLYGKNFAELERKVNDTSCFNPDILPLNDHEFLLVYSDSRHRDEDGSIRKSIRCRKISVEV